MALYILSFLYKQWKRLLLKTNVRILANHPLIALFVTYGLLAPFLVVDSYGDNVGAQWILVGLGFIEEIPATKIFFLVATVILITFSIPLWKRLNKRA